MSARQGEKPLKGSWRYIVFLYFFLLLFPFLAYADELNYPVAAYSEEELAKVREWEKEWVGKKIDKSNIDQVAEFMPESYAGIYKDPDKWGAGTEGLYFTIVPYRPVMETKGMIEATKKYAPLVKTNPDGTIENYAEIAGIPYPDPKTGLEIAWNFDSNNHGDTAHYQRDGPNINPKQRTERYSNQEQWEVFFMHRTELEPKPALPDNPEGRHRGLFIHMWDPPEFLNTRYYNLRFTDPKKDDHCYLWYAQFRRVRRLSTAQRTDAIDGTDLIYDDEFFWDGHIVRNNYTYQGKKELLCARHQDMQKTSRPTGQAIQNNYMLERCNLLVVDVINKDPNYLYGKRVWYLDPATYLILWTEIYDELGRYWKCFMNQTNDLKTDIGETKNFIVGTSFIDFQRTHAGVNVQNVKAISSSEITTDMFTISYLQRTY